MRVRLRLFGRTIASLLFDGDAVELEEEPPQGITGGPDLYTERDPYPIIPEERHNHEYDRFGFRAHD